LNVTKAFTGNPKGFALTCYRLLVAANGMAGDAKDKGINLDDATWANQSGGIYGGIYQAWVGAMDQVYGDLSEEIRDRVSRSFGDDLSASDLDAMAREILTERHDSKIRDNLCKVVDYLSDIAIMCDDATGQKVGDKRAAKIRQIQDNLRKLYYLSDGDNQEAPTWDGKGDLWDHLNAESGK
jgi:hypothetical protein